MPQLKPPNGMTEAAANEAQAKAALGRSRSFGVPPVRLRAPEKRSCIWAISGKARDIAPSGCCRFACRRHTNPASGSHETGRWRKADSNHRSRPQRREPSKPLHIAGGHSSQHSSRRQACGGEPRTAGRLQRAALPSYPLTLRKPSHRHSRRTVTFSSRAPIQAARTRPGRIRPSMLSFS